MENGVTLLPFFLLYLIYSTSLSSNLCEYDLGPRCKKIFCSRAFSNDSSFYFHFSMLLFKFNIFRKFDNMNESLNILRLLTIITK